MPFTRLLRIQRKTDERLRHRGYCSENKVRFQACRRRSYSGAEEEAMAAREEAEEVHHSCYRLHGNGVDVLLNNGDKDNRAKDLGPI